MFHDGILLVTRQHPRGWRAEAIVRGCRARKAQLRRREAAKAGKATTQGGRFGWTFMFEGINLNEHDM